MIDEQTRVQEKEIRSSYNRFPYPSHPFAQTHIASTGAIASIFGIAAPPVEQCRVLEMGCGSGGNLLPMALDFPNSEFIGVDLSSRHIEIGQEMRKALSLSNVELKTMSILDIDESLGCFDYIIAHGVYSWVPKIVQEKMLQVIEDHLADKGIAYISYNTYPGWYLREKFRTMIHFPVRDIYDPYKKMDRAIDFLDFLKGNSTDPTYQEEIKAITPSLEEARANPPYFFHEYLEKCNSPLYFYQFVESAQKHGLQYLAEADMRILGEEKQLKEFFTREFPELNFDDPVVLGHHVDCTNNRTFRQTLLCRQSIMLERKRICKQIESLYVTGRLEPVSSNANPKSGKAEEFQDVSGVKIVYDNPFVKTALCHLREVFPHYLTLDELFAATQVKLGTMVSSISKVRVKERELTEALLSLHEKGIVYFRTVKPRFITTISERPVACPLARRQVLSGPNVTNCSHDRCFFDSDFVRYLLPHLDGTNDREALAEIMEKFVYQGKLVVMQEGFPSTDSAYIKAQIRESLAVELETISTQLLLIG